MPNPDSNEIEKLSQGQGEGGRLSSWPVINDPQTAKDAGRSSSVNRKERVSLWLDLHGQLNPEREEGEYVVLPSLLPPKASR